MLIELTRTILMTWLKFSEKVDRPFNVIFYLVICFQRVIWFRCDAGYQQLYPRYMSQFIPLKEKQLSELLFLSSNSEIVCVPCLALRVYHKYSIVLLWIHTGLTWDGSSDQSSISSSDSVSQVGNMSLRNDLNDVNNMILFLKSNTQG